MAGKDSALSIRLARDLLVRLERIARGKGVPRSALVERYLEEAVRMEAHPGIVFRDGPAGRRPALRRGPDVWEVISALKANDRSAKQTATVLGLPESDVRIAVTYYGDHADEIEEWIRTNEEESARAEAAWRRQRAIARD